LIVATIHIALISFPLRSRFLGGIYRLEFYIHDEIQEIINKFSSDPIGLYTVAPALLEEMTTVEKFNEAYLIEIGFFLV
jgi:Holliday junction resolvasome RuvABC ATP-dependent DNA helicase subunit